jgi:acetyl esterase/lipase
VGRVSVARFSYFNYDALGLPIYLMMQSGLCLLLTTTRQVVSVGALRMIGAQGGIERSQLNHNLTVPIANDVKIETIAKRHWSAKLISPPHSDPNRAVLYLHGFGLLCKAHADTWGTAAEIARASGCSLLQLEYRFAPEHCYADAVDDCCAAFDWLRSEWYEPEKVCLIGESVGAALALTTLDAVRRTQNVSAGPSVLISPVLNANTHKKANGQVLAHEPAIDADSLERICLFLESGGRNGTDASFAICPDLRGLPPILIQAGGNDVFRNDAQLLFQQAKRAWLDVDLDVWPEMTHGWHHRHDTISQGRQAINRIGEFLSKKTDF